MEDGLGQEFEGVGNHTSGEHAIFRTKISFDVDQSKQALKTVAAFNEMISSRGNVAGDEDVLGDGIAFARVAKYPTRIKCALLSWMTFKDAVAQASEETPDERDRNA